MADDRPDYVLHPIGIVESPLVDAGDAPRQGDEGAPEACIVLDPSVRQAMIELEVGSEVIVLTWLDQADRTTLRVHPRGDHTRPERGVFTTRSQHRPNPIGLHRVEIVAIDDLRLRVRNFEALDRTPVLDIKPVLGPTGER